MKFILSLFIIVTATSAQAYHGVELKAGLGYDTNVYYSGGNGQQDVYLHLLPSWKNTYEVTSRYRLIPDLELELTKYLGESTQDYFEYRFEFKNIFKVTQRWFMELTPKYQFDSEPAHTDIINNKNMQKRLGKNTYGLNLGINYYKDPRRQVISQISAYDESFDLSKYEFQNNRYYNGTIYYKKYFLPETFFYWGYRGSYKSYPNQGLAPTGRRKFDHTRYEIGAGVEGRLTRYFKIRSYLGYPYLKFRSNFASGNSFFNPIMLVEIEEELSPKDMLVMGYQTSAEDSYFGNFMVEQKLYLGYGRLFGDQLFVTGKVEYSYKNFVGEEVRDDQRLVAVLSMEYSQSERLKYEWVVDYNRLDSAALNKFRVDYASPIIDSPASFRRTSTTLYMKYQF